MNYQKAYDKLIEFRLKNKIYKDPLKPGEIEIHHIKMKSIFPELAKDPNNLVALTLREHFIAHKLLAKIYLNTPYELKALTAFSLMCVSHMKHGGEKIKCSRVFERLRLQISIASAGENNPMYGKKLKDCMSPKKYKEMCNKRSNTITGNRKMYKYSNNQRIIKHVLKADIEFYLANGWKFIHERKQYKPKDKKQYVRSISCRQNISKSHRAHRNPMYGKTYNWYTDGKTNLQIFEGESIPVGNWRPGKINYVDYSLETIAKLSESKRGTKNPMYGKKWYTDGKVAHQYFPGDEPNGWRPGRK